MEWFQVMWFAVIVMVTVSFIVVTVLQGIIDLQDTKTLSMDCYMLSVFSIMLSIIAAHNLPWR